MASHVDDRATLEKTLRDYLVAHSGVPIKGELSREENLLETGILDSLGIAEITEFMEKTFALVIDEDEVSSQNYGSLARLTDFVGGKLAARAA